MIHDVYRETLLDHYRHPRHSSLLDQPTHQADTANRSCGDRVRVTLQVADGRIKQVGIAVDGCALAVAGGSVVAEFVLGKSIDDAKSLTDVDIFRMLGNIEPSVSRAQCATLALGALKRSLRS